MLIFQLVSEIEIAKALYLVSFHAPFQTSLDPGWSVERDQIKVIRGQLTRKKIDEMKIKIRDIDWSDLLNIENPNQSMTLFYSKFNQIFDRVCPLVLRKVRIYLVSHGLLKAC